ncbi:PadR family transcriptional regulator [Micromonospora rubida]|uniref:PadR family transcriptional regulator n=1 Tax=Micromonospora rubida TaxID=2697657 RepID=UPI00137808E4|nr:hypothetical protein [Micromonospora rubida]
MAFWILTTLTGRPLHGYGIVGEVAVLSEDRLSLRPGTLYGALDRLLETDLVQIDREEVVDGCLRRYYRLSRDGNIALTPETERMRRNVRAVTARLRNRMPETWPATPQATGDLYEGLERRHSIGDCSGLTPPLTGVRAGRSRRDGSFDFVSSAVPPPSL